MKFFLLLSTILSCTISRAQSILNTPIEFPTKINERFIFNTKSDYQKIVTSGKKEIKPRDLKRFAEVVTYGKQNLFTSGSVYLDWVEMEEYLNKILQRILPDSLKLNDKIHVYTGRNSELNAFAIHDGSLFFNVGMFSDVQNEAAIAIILGHELSHFLNQDSKNSFLKGLKLFTKKNRNNNSDLALEKAHEDREHEKTADLTGFVFAEKAGYDLSYGICNFNTFKECLEIENLKKSKESKIKVSIDSLTKNKFKSLDMLLATHPDLSDRVYYLESYLKSSTRTNSKKDFIISDKAAFNVLQSRARYENLNLLLNDNQYRDCIQKAFVYHLIAPDDNNYIYYLLESIRRLTYLNYKYENQGFLTEDNQSKKFKTGEGILHDLSYIIRDGVKLASLKAKTLTDTSRIEFETYDQAFNYFSKIALNRNISESILTIALRENDKDLKKSYLNKYITCKDVKYKEYANAIINNSIYTELEQNKKSIVLMENISFNEDHYYGEHSRLILSEQKSPEYFQSITKSLNKKHPAKELVNITELSFENLRSKLNFENAINTTRFIKPLERYTVTSYYKEVEEEKKKKEIDVFMLNPDYWNLFKQNGLNSIEYINISSFQDKTAIIGAPFKFIITTLASTAFPPFLIYYIFSDSEIYSHSVNYYSFDIKTKKPYYYYKEVNHKLTKRRAQRMINDVIKSKPEIK